MCYPGRPRSGRLPGAARHLRLARRLGGERAALDVGAGSVGSHRHSGGGDLGACELETRGYRAAVEQALSLSEHQRERPEPELVDEAVLEQRLDQVPAAVHLQLGAILLLARADPVGHLALYQLLVLPVELGELRRGHVLGRIVERLSAWIVGVRPVGRENLVGVATEDEVEGLRHRLSHRPLHLLVPVAERPAAVLEAATAILLGAARRLHDAVEGQEGVHDELSHVRVPFSGFDLMTGSGGEIHRRRYPFAGAAIVAPRNAPPVRAGWRGPELNWRHPTSTIAARTRICGR